MENTRKWRYGVNRWFVLAFILLAVVTASIYPPIRPHISVATDRLSAEPLFTLPVIGPFYLTNTITTLILVDVIVILLALAVRNSLRKSEDLVPRGISGAMEWVIEILYNMSESTAGRWTNTIFPWFASIMIIVLISNWAGLIPGMEAVGFVEHAEEGGHSLIQILPGVMGMVSNPGEWNVVPFFRGMSTDLNFTVALALIVVVAVQVVGVRAQGWHYIYRFFNVKHLFDRPAFGAMDFAVSLLELISEFSKVLSFSFRLFGNMFAGMVLLFLLTSMAPWFFPSAIMLFEFFIGAIQAFVFGMLTLVFMSQATQGHQD